MNLTGLDKDCFNYLLDKLSLIDVAKLEILSKEVQLKVHHFYLKILNDHHVNGLNPKDILAHIMTWEAIPSDFQESFALFKKQILAKGFLRIRASKKSIPNQSQENTFHFRKGKKGEVCFEILSLRSMPHGSEQIKETYLLQKEIQVINGTEIEAKIAQNKVKNHIDFLIENARPVN